ncbi:MAG: methyltransferase domain-containing protein [bacterium]
MEESFLVLLLTGLGNFFYNAGLLTKEAFSLGWRPWWWKMRLAAFFVYLKDPPHRVILREKASLTAADEDLIYGETPPLTMKKLLEQVQAGPEDVFYDLGCGRGLTVLTAARVYNMTAVGVDMIPTFIERARKTKKFLGRSKSDFILSSFLDVDLSRATIVYTASTTFSEETMKALAEKLKALKAGARVITLSAPLKSSHFSLSGSGVFDFTWGKTHAYFHSFIGSDP